MVQGAERGHGSVAADGPVPREGLALAIASAACKACPGTQTSSNRCAPTSTDSAKVLVSRLVVRQAQGRFRAHVFGLTLHAAVRCGADDRRGLEQLCRYIRRPALASERVQTNAAGQVELKLKTPSRDGTSHPAPVAAGVHAAAGCAGAQTQAAPDSLSWRSRTQRQAARAGGAAGTRTTCAGRSVGRVRGDVRASPPSAAELGRAA